MRRRQARPASNSGVSPGRDAGRSSVSDVMVLLVVGLFVVVLMSVRNMGTSAQSMVVGAASPAAPAHTRAKQVAASHRAAKRLDELVNMAAAAEIRRRGDNAAAVEGISVTADSVVIQRAEQDLHEQIGSAIVQDSGQSGMMETGAAAVAEDQATNESPAQLGDLAPAASASSVLDASSAVGAEAEAPADAADAVGAEPAASYVATDAKATSEEVALQQPRLRGSAAAAGVASPSADAGSSACKRFEPLYVNLEPDLKHIRAWVQKNGPLSFKDMIESYKKEIAKPGQQDYFMSVMMIKDNKLYCVPSGADGQQLAFKKPEMVTHEYDAKGQYNEKKRKSWCYPVEISIDRQERIFMALHGMLKKYKVPDTYFMVHTRDSALFFKSRSSAPVLVFADAKRSYYQDMTMPGHTFTDGVDKKGTWENFVRVQVPKLAAVSPWSSKKDQCVWRGTETSGRVRFVEKGLVDAPAADQSLYDVKFSGGYREHMKYAKYVSIADHAKYKFLLHLDGTGYSSRYMKLVALNSVTLKQRSPHHEFFEAALKPYVHFLPFGLNEKGDEQGLEEMTEKQVSDGFLNLGNLTATMRWALEHEEEAQQIARNGMKFVRDYLVMDGVYCYWREALHRLNALQAPGLELPTGAELFDPKIHAPDALDVISSA